jgi:hypothetical protein
LRIKIGIGLASIIAVAAVAAVILSPHRDSTTSGPSIVRGPANAIVDAGPGGTIVRSPSAFAGISRHGTTTWSAPDLLAREAEIACYGECPDALAWSSGEALGRPEVADPPAVSFTPRRKELPIIVARRPGKRLYGYVGAPNELVYVDASLTGGQTLHLVVRGVHARVPVSGVVDVRAYVSRDARRIFVALDQGPAGVSGGWYERRKSILVSRGSVADLPSPYGCTDDQTRAVVLVGPQAVRVAFGEAKVTRIAHVRESSACYQESDGIVFATFSSGSSGPSTRITKVDGTRQRWSYAFGNSSVSGSTQSGLTAVVANEQLVILGRDGKRIRTVSSVDDARIVGHDLVVVLPNGRVRFERLPAG